MKFDSWLLCESCSAEYKVLGATSNDMDISYCPYCGTENEDVLEDLDFSEDDE